jgi:Cu/Ag efflux protein CusF
MQRRHLLALIPVFAAACGTRREARFDYGEPKQRYHLRGKVLRLRPEARVASIDHEKIDGWMEAMTMEFPIPKEEDFAKLKEGAVIRATVNVNDLNYWLTDVVVE